MIEALIMKIDGTMIEANINCSFEEAEAFSLYMQTAGVEQLPALATVFTKIDTFTRGVGDIRAMTYTCLGQTMEIKVKEI